VLAAGREPVPVERFRVGERSLVTEDPGYIPPGGNHSPCGGISVRVLDPSIVGRVGMIAGQSYGLYEATRAGETVLMISTMSCTSAPDTGASVRIVVE